MTSISFVATITESSLTTETIKFTRKLELACGHVASLRNRLVRTISKKRALLQLRQYLTLGANQRTNGMSSRSTYDHETVGVSYKFIDKTGGIQPRQCGTTANFHAKSKSSAADLRGV